MNILNFNNGIVGDMFDHFGMRKSVALSSVFYGAEPSEDCPTESAKSFIRSGCKMLPFPETRIWQESLPYHKAQGIGSFRTYCEESETIGVRFLRVAFTTKGRPEHGAFYQMKFNIDSGKWDEKEGVWNSRWARPDEITEEISEWIKLNICAVILFLSEINSPANFIAAVRPNKIGKSVQWMACRTHYVILHKSHPANTKDLASGDAVQEDSAYVKRQAHSRRAHYRILRSPVFRHKIGQRVWVRSAWVGPKEWQQASSIYKLHEPAAA